MEVASISLQQSELEIHGHCTISDSYATRGGGVHARSSTITVYPQGTLHITNNNAIGSGGALYLEVNPKLYLLKNVDMLFSSFDITTKDQIIFFW